MRRALLCCAVCVGLLGAPGSAAADQVTPDSRQVVGGSAAVTGCGPLGGIGISWTSTANVVTDLRLTSIPPACVGARLSLTLAGAAAASLTSLGPITVSSTSLVLTPTGSPTATAVTGAYVSVVGP